MIVIGKLKDGTVPTIDLQVKIKKDTPATPGDIAVSTVVTLNNIVKDPSKLKLVHTDIVQNAKLPAKPAWKVKVALGDAAQAKEGSNIYVNALLSFEKKPGERLNVSDVGEGDWLFPIVVTDDKNNNYLLAYVKVIITWESKEPEQEQ
jgi:hypothetical protein